MSLWTQIGSEGRLRWARAAAFALTAFASLTGGLHAQDAAAPPQPEDGLKGLFKTFGLVADPAEPQDFVVKARPAGEEDYIPVGRKPFDRKTKVKTAAEIKAIEADLEAVRTRHDAIRSTFAPAVKAVAAADAARAAKPARWKDKPKPPSSPQ